MELREAINVAQGAIRGHKMRAILTALGVVIGVASVIGLMAIVSGIRDSVARQFNSLGAEMISINRWEWGASDSGEDYTKRKALTMLEFETVRALPTVDVATPTVYTSRELRFRNTRVGGVVVVGTNEAYPVIENWTMADGRFLTGDDVRSTRSVVVLGADVAKNLFPDGGALEQEVRIAQFAYTVVGVFERKGSIFGDSQDNIVAVSYTTFGKHFGMTRRDINIGAVARPPHTMQETIDEIRASLRRVRKVPDAAPDDFAINTSDRLIQQFNGITQGLFMVMVLIGGMSLLVGGIGIMNIMLVSVTERTREIGIRKAIGARSRDVVRQFLIEAVILCAAGGLVGVALGCGIGIAVEQGTPVPARITPWSIVLGLGVSTIIGIVFGLWPAVRASQLDPVEALRYE